MENRKKCLVIGSNSFSGSYFTKFLLLKEYSVFAISRSQELGKVFNPYKNLETKENLKFFQLDINRDIPAIVELIKNNHIEYIVNFAAQSMVAESWKNPDHWFSTNVVSTISLHNELRKLDFLKKYVHVSTPEVYGNCEGKVDENYYFNPSTPYAVSRAAADMSLKTFGESYDFPFVITRAANVYGACQQLYRIIPRTIFYILTKKKLKLHGGGFSKRSFIHINDVCDATHKIMIKGKKHNTYHISTNKLISINDLVRLICEKMQVRFEKSVDIVDERLGKDANYFLDSSKLRMELNWNDEFSLEKGLSSCIDWVDKNLTDLKMQPSEYIHKE